MPRMRVAIRISAKKKLTTSLQKNSRWKNYFALQPVNRVVILSRPEEGEGSKLQPHRELTAVEALLKPASSKNCRSSWRLPESLPASGLAATRRLRERLRVDRPCDPDAP